MGHLERFIRERSCALLLFVGIAATISGCSGDDDKSSGGVTDPPPPVYEHELAPSLYDQRVSQLGNTIRFKITYRDLAGDEPVLHKIVFPYNHIGARNMLGGDGEIEEGVMYYFDVATAGRHGVSLEYYFKFDDGFGNAVRYPSSGLLRVVSK